MNIIQYFLAKLRNRRFSVQNKIGNDLIFGCIYKFNSYLGWKKDPYPMIFVMYSGPMRFVHKSGHYTDGINLNYLDMSQKMWLARTIYLMRKGNQKMNGAFFYRFLKSNRPDIVRKAYRRYHTQRIIKPRMVSAAITNLDKLVYPYNDQFIQKLNESISPIELTTTGIKVAYSSTELMDRINQAQNSVNINTIRQNAPQPQNLAPWVRQV